MTGTAERLIEIWRGDFCESVHSGHVAVWHADTGLVAAWGDETTTILPRSSCKMIQALPLVESGAADAHGLSDAHLALACASHSAGHVHTDMVTAWLDDLGLDETALRCGSQWPSDEPARDALILDQAAPDQRHNNCSGKHSGFLTLGQHLGTGPEYLEIDHPVQQAVLAAFEDVTEEPSPGFAIDGCSAPNHATSVTGLARAMAAFAAADESNARGRAMVRLRNAMMAHPLLVSGAGRSCNLLMTAMAGRAAVKTGAEAVFIAIVPEHRIGVALKVTDGGTRGAEAAIAQILIGLGVLEADHPAARQFTHGPITNRREIETGHMRPADSLRDWRF